MLGISPDEQVRRFLLSPMSLKRGFNRLHKRKDIIRVYAKGERVWGVSFDLIVLRGGGERLRIAIVVPLLGKKAVDRNRVKRRIKEVLRRGDFLAPIVGDLIVRAKRAAYDLDYAEIQKELEKAFSSLNRG